MNDEEEFPQVLSNAQKRILKGLAQSMEPTLKVGKNGLSAPFIDSVNDALTHLELIKVKFSEFKEHKEELSKSLAHTTNSHLIMLIGNVAIFYRQNPNPEDRKVLL